MRIELLYINECPNSDEAARRLNEALIALGHQRGEFDLRLIDTPADTVGTVFAGSPTITLDGADIFPGGAATSDLACRIYQTPGGLAGLPTVDQIKQALTGHGV
ncbi:MULTISPECIES: thioredoxin family protein [Arthrobacter]|uniref:Thioredoxin family protein n=1 Tax=Arthrobacter terricola TaxID=2547396 RepID=A0A4R5KG59_9MICC|nr:MULTISPECIES: thioredoxin family protein [Arthrobacter]MBT8161949.1 thioredoxin family protein [Arthrobacter sp. GN70]TDF94323.1 thioredoxin family protein [Arthrobacter terricola]